jgi:hypothetical protein
MQVGNVSTESIARQRFAMLSDARTSGGLVMSEYAPGEYFACCVLEDPVTKQSQLIPLARILTGVADTK